MRGGGGGGGILYAKGRGAYQNYFEKTPKRDQDPVLRVWLEFLFTVRGANSRTEHYFLSCCFPLNTPKGIARAHTVDLMWLNVLRGTTYLTPKRCDQQPCHVYMEVPPPPRT